MPKIIVEPGRIQVLESMSPYDGFVRGFLQTMGDVRGVLVSGYPAILLGRSRQTEDIDMLLAPMKQQAFFAWWARMEAAGLWCLNAVHPDTAWTNLQDHIALRFAPKGTVLPNMEVKFVWDQHGRRTLAEAWSLDLLGQAGFIGDLSDQVAFKLLLGSEKDWEDAEHIAIVASKVLDWARLQATALSLGVPHAILEKFRRQVHGHP